MKIKKIVITLSVFFAFTCHFSLNAQNLENWQLQIWENAPSGIADTLYFPFQDDIQMIIITNYYAWESRVRYFDRYSVTSGFVGVSNSIRRTVPAFPNIYIFRNEKGEILNVYNNIRETENFCIKTNRKFEKINFSKNDFKKLSEATIVNDSADIYEKYFIFYDYSSDSILDNTSCRGYKVVGDYHKKGLINRKGEVVLEAKYDCIYLNSLENRQIPKTIVINDGKFGFLDSTFIEITPVKFQLVSEYYGHNCIKISRLNENHIITAVDNLWGIIDFSGNVLIDFKYSSVREHDRGHNTYIVTTPSGNIITLNAETFQPVVSGDYSHIEYLHSVSRKDGSTSLPYWRENEFVRYYVVGRNGKYGIVDEDNKSLVPLEYDERITFHPCRSTNAPRYTVRKQNHYGVLNREFDLVIPIEYDSIVYRLQTIQVKRHDKWGFYDRREFQLLIEPVIDKIYGILTPEYFIIEENGKKGLLNEYHYVGLVLIPPKYDEIRPFYKNFFVVAKNGKRKFLNAVSGNERDILDDKRHHREQFIYFD